MKQIYFILLTSSILFILGGCSTQRQVQRISEDQTIDLSGRWNDSDSRIVAEEMIDQLLHHPWMDQYNAKNPNKRPILIVGLIRNKSHEHIDANTFIKEIEKAIIQDASARLVQAGSKRDALRQERMDQQNFASSETAKNWGLELGADYMLQGTIHSIVDSYKKEKIVYYQVNLELSNLETNEIVWMGEKRIKKYVKN